jgi:hypothetical protein
VPALGNGNITTLAVVIAGSRAKGPALRGDNSTTTYLTNEYGGAVLFKFENCFDGFGLLDGGSPSSPQKLYVGIDGVRPPSWFPDWAKCINGGRLKVKEDGTAWFLGRNFSGGFWPDCEAPNLCDSLPGRKTEPAWSNYYHDWKQPTSQTRLQVCDRSDLMKPRAR